MKIETWDINQLRQVNLPSHLNDEYQRIFNGFTFFGPTLISKLKKSKDSKTLVALEDTIVGVLVFEWRTRPFGRYYVNTIDIEKNHKNQKIGTTLIKTLDDAEFLKGKILQLGHYSEEGDKYIRHVFENELMAKDYALISGTYHSRKPKGTGIFADDGDRLRSRYPANM